MITKKLSAYRYAEGVIINPKEYLLDEDGDVILFNTEKEIKSFLNLKENDFLEDYRVYTSVEYIRS